MLVRLSRNRSAVHAVVDAVDEVSLVDRQADELGLVLFHDGLDVGGHARDAVDVLHGLVGAMGANGACRRRVHAGELPVRLHVRVVDVHLVRAAEVFHGIVIHDGQTSRRSHGQGSSTCNGGHLLAPSIKPANHRTDTKARSSEAEDARLRLRRKLLGRCEVRKLRNGGRTALDNAPAARLRCHVRRRRDAQEQNGCETKSGGRHRRELRFKHHEAGVRP
mmetsp:Transcript_11846/g.31900  ORF Transcript_11846/g.31900 Transcript_11846/m.31900 type:complete len:220 (+) Transcript_11846:153-812(+)